MININSAQAENQTHLIQSCFGFSKSRVLFALKFTGLSDQQKVIWMVLAILSAEDPEFTCHASYEQLARMLGKSPRSIRLAIEALIAMVLFEYSERESGLGSLTESSRFILFNPKGCAASLKFKKKCQQRCMLNE